MKVVGSFNAVSEKLKQELIKPLEKGKVVFFQLLNGSYDPGLKREVFGASKSIRLSDRIKDPYKGNGGEFVDIGVPEEIKDGRVVRCGKYWVESIANGIPGNGQFSLSGSNFKDVEIYEYLCLSNDNKNNPYRDESAPPKYEMVDAESKRKADAEKEFKELRAKLARLGKTDPEKAKELASLIPQDKEEKVKL